MTIAFISNIYRDQSSSLGYVFIFPVFWIIAGIILIVLFRRKKIRLNFWLDKLVLVCSTPVTIFLIVAFHFITSDGLITSSYEYNKNGHRHKEVKYEYSSGGPTQRVEYYISKDPVTDTTPFPTNDVWLQDSVWTYYDKDGTIEKSEDYRTK